MQDQITPEDGGTLSQQVTLPLTRPMLDAIGNATFALALCSAQEIVETLDRSTWEDESNTAQAQMLAARMSSRLSTLYTLRALRANDTTEDPNAVTCDVTMPRDLAALLLDQARMSEADMAGVQDDDVAVQYMRTSIACADMLAALKEESTATERAARVAGASALRDTLGLAGDREQVTTTEGV